MGNLFVGLFHIVRNLLYMCFVMLCMKSVFIVRYKRAAREYQDTRIGEEKKMRAEMDTFQESVCRVTRLQCTMFHKNKKTYIARTWVFFFCHKLEELVQEMSKQC